MIWNIYEVTPYGRFKLVSLSHPMDAFKEFHRLKSNHKYPVVMGK